jgi:hypothetical protein
MFDTCKSSIARSICAAGIVTGLIFGVYGQWAVNFKPHQLGAGIDAAEPIVQIQNTNDLFQAMTIIKKFGKVGAKAQDQATIHAPIAWPLAWYLRDWTISYPDTITGNENTAVIIVDALFSDENLDISTKLEQAGYVSKRLNFNNRTTWIDKMAQEGFMAAFASITHFMVFHDTWGDSVVTHFDVWINKEAANQMNW